ncbi:MAG: hypothetical protein GYA24_17080 [Candidatus Lokiarchaeota archaeon]|nr:hypothetical protein [Candidatus Lokiarchaeota archaeon]
MILLVNAWRLDPMPRRASKIARARSLAFPRPPAPARARPRPPVLAHACPRLPTPFVATTRWERWPPLTCGIPAKRGMLVNHEDLEIDDEGLKEERENE